jgi:hypothetical protein
MGPRLGLVVIAIALFIVFVIGRLVLRHQLGRRVLEKMCQDRRSSGHICIALGLWRWRLRFLNNCRRIARMVDCRAVIAVIGRGGFVEGRS